MSDQRIRELEREYREGADPGAGAKLLHLREQAGALPPDAREVLALLQDPAALLSTPAASPFPDSWETLRDWIQSLRMLHASVLPRALHAWIRRVHSLLLVDGGTSDAVGALDNLAGLFEDELREWILREGQVWRPDWTKLVPPYPQFGLEPRQHTCETLLRLAALEFMRPVEPDPRHWEDALLERLSGVEPAWVGELTAAIAADLAPWAWGARDPLRDPRPLSLEAVKIASPCGVSWDAMRGDGRARSCAQCSRMVFDLASLSDAEARTLLAREGRSVCVQLYRREDGRVLTTDCPVGLRARLQHTGPAMRGMLA